MLWKKEGWRAATQKCGGGGEEEAVLVLTRSAKLCAKKKEEIFNNCNETLKSYPYSSVHKLINTIIFIYKKTVVMQQYILY
jgi:hypothetical protein